MAAIESPETVGIRPFHEFDEAQNLWPRGERPAALRDAAQEFRARFKQQGQIRAVRTIDLASAGYPTAFALAGAAKGLNPFVNIRNRLVIVQFEDFDGELKTLVWEPTIPEGSVEAPFYEQLLERYGETLSYKIFGKIFNSVDDGLSQSGLTREDIDFVSFHPRDRAGRRIAGGHDGPCPDRPRAEAAVLPKREVPEPAQGG